MSKSGRLFLALSLAITVASTVQDISYGQAITMPDALQAEIPQPAIQHGAEARKIADSQSLANDPLNQPLRSPANKTTSLATSPSSTGMTLTTVVGGLAICVGVFLLFVWATRRNAPKTMGPLPPEVLEPLGRATLSGRQQLQLIRLGKKLILLNVTATSADAIAEIDDPDEVLRLTGLCQQAKPNSVTATFREVLGQYDQRPESKGYFASMRQADPQRSDRGTRRMRVAQEDIDD